VCEQRQEIEAHHDETRAREERLRQIVENALKDLSSDPAFSL